MSDDDQVRGPTMLAATNMLKSPPPVIGSVNSEITLPRTIKLTTLALMVAGTIIGFLVGLIFVDAGLKALMYGPGLGGAAGWAAANVSPLPGESLARWLGLQFDGTRRRKLAIDGRPVRLYVGIAPLRRTAAGTVRILPGGVPVGAVQWDSRGLPLQEIPGVADLPPAPGRRRRPGRRRSASTQVTGGARRTRRARGARPRS